MLPRLFQGVCAAVADVCLHQLASRMFGQLVGNFSVSFKLCIAKIKVFQLVEFLNRVAPRRTRMLMTHN